jgi:hypothetical protein
MSADAPLRKSIPAYYFRPVRDGEVVDARSTRFLEVERGRCPHTTPVEFGRCPLCWAHI